MHELSEDEVGEIFMIVILAIVAILVTVKFVVATITGSLAFVW